jgi:hypothetical protein
MVISGGDFRLDGIQIEALADVGSELSLDIPDGAVLSGALLDGTPFAFSSRAFDEFAPGSLTLQSQGLPPIGPDLLIASSDPIPFGIRHGQTLVVDAGGVVGSFFNAGRGSTLIVEEDGTLGANLETVGAEVVINGGSVGGRIHAYDSHVTLAGGTVDAGYYSLIASGSVVDVTGGDVGPTFSARDGSQVTMSGGSIGRLSSVRGGSQLTVSGGSIGDSFTVHSGSEATITGGHVGSSFNAQDGSRVHVSGGTFGSIRAMRGSQITVSGGEFRLNGAPIERLENVGATVPFELPGGAVLSGVLADGTPFAFGSYDGDSFPAGTLTLQSALLPPIGSATIIASTDPVPLGIRQGQTLIVDAGSAVGESFNAGRGSTVIVEEGGFVGSNLEVVGAEVTIRGGTVDAGMDILDGSRATISGGSVGDKYFGGFSVSDSEVIVAGGSILRGFRALRNSQVTIAGGSVGDFSSSLGGSQITISGGSVGNFFEAFAGSRVAISGGTLGDRFRADDESRITVSGGEFRLDGALVEGLESIGSTRPLNLPRDGVLSGVLADGTPFAFSYDDGDSLPIGTLTLQKSALPSIGPAQIVASKDTVPLGIREGQALLVDASGVVGDNFNAGRGSSVSIEEGGRVGDNFEAIEAEVTVAGGAVGGAFHAFNGSQVTISGGVLGDGYGIYGVRASGSRVIMTGGEVRHSLSALGGSDVNVAGGSVAGRFTAYDGSQVNLSGGLVGGAFEAFGGSQVTLAGGTLANVFRAIEGSRVTISGGEFYLNGDRIEGLGSDGATMRFDVPAGAVLSGVFADGTPFAFSSNDLDSLTAGTLTLHSSPLPPIGPLRIVASTDMVPLGIRQGQTLVVDAGGVVAEGFNAGRGSTVIIEEGGVLNKGFEAVGAEVRVNGGSVNYWLQAFDGTRMNISGGTVVGLSAYGDSDVSIAGGSIHSSNFYGTVAVSGGSVDGFHAGDGSRVTIAGGTMAGATTAATGSHVTIAGGVFDGEFHAGSGSLVNIVGSGFSLGGTEVSGLVAGEAFPIETRDLALAGILADGTPFRFDLNSNYSVGNDRFDPNATLTVTLLVPEPTANWLACLAAIVAAAAMRTLPFRL